MKTILFTFLLLTALISLSFILLVTKDYCGAYDENKERERKNYHGNQGSQWTLRKASRKYKINRILSQSTVTQTYEGRYQWRRSIRKKSKHFSRKRKWEYLSLYFVERDWNDGTNSKNASWFEFVCCMARIPGTSSSELSSS